MARGRCWPGDGRMLETAPAPHSTAYAKGATAAQARADIISYAERAGFGVPSVRYHLRDWIFARQRYWGEPIPVIHWDDGSITATPLSALPLELPFVEDFKPIGDGRSSLARAVDWITVIDPATGRKGTRETSTMPNWAGSSWYPLRFMDPNNNNALVDPEKAKLWGPVDLYIGGAEHATLHLLYARFWYQAMYDLGLAPFKEPFRKLVNQGMLVSYAFQNARGVIVAVDDVQETAEGTFIHTASGERVERIVTKMSKSLRNVVTPDEVIQRFGSDAFRMFLMFMGPVEGPRVWDTEQVSSTARLLRRVWNFATAGLDEGLRDFVARADEAPEVSRALSTLILNITEDIDSLRLNTAVAEIMKFMNVVEKQAIARESMLDFVKVLNPLAPHLAEELWMRAGHASSIANEAWPEREASDTAAGLGTVTVVVQVGGRKRDQLEIPTSVTDGELRALVLSRLQQQGRIAADSPSHAHIVRDKTTGAPRLVNVPAPENG
jgi:leucyl-tRNA synthetase